MKITSKMIEMAYDEFDRLQGEIRIAKKLVADLEKEQSIHEKILLEGIAPNESKNGIFHKRTVGKSISYSKALEKIREVLIPKSKSDATDLILEEFTKETFRDSFDKE